MITKRALLAGAGAVFLSDYGWAVPGSYDHTMVNVFRHEGGWFNHPNDPGGATMYGITIHDVRKYLNPSATPADVRRITRAQAAAIYRTRYWDAVRGDELPAGVDQTVMDLGVNSGVGRGRSFLRRAVGLNGVQVPLTDREIKIVNEHSVPDRGIGIIKNINAQRQRFVRALGTYRHFGRGWESRISYVLRDSLAMAAGTSGAEFGPYERLRRAPGHAILSATDLDEVE